MGNCQTFGSWLRFPVGKAPQRSLEERPEELSDYEEYEEEVEIPAKDLEKYVNLHHDQKNLFNMKWAW